MEEKQLPVNRPDFGKLKENYLKQQSRVITKAEREQLLIQIMHADEDAGLYEDQQEVEDYKCPKCGTYHNDDEYTVDGRQYPIIRNERKGSTMDGMYHNWDELHMCECGERYWFLNGAY